MKRMLNLSTLLAMVGAIALAAGCGASTPKSTSSEGEGEGPGGEGEGEGAAEGEGEGAAEGEGEGPSEGEGEGPAEGEGEGGAPHADPADVDANWGHCIYIYDLKVDGQSGFDLDGELGGDADIDNELALVGLVANGEIKNAIDSGDMILVAELRADDPQDNAAFPVNMYTGEDMDEDPTDNPSGEEEFQVDIRSFNQDGTPLIRFDGTTIEARHVIARTDQFLLSFPVGGEGAESMFSATLWYARMEADVEGEFAGLINGNLGGAAREDEIRTAIEQFDIPENLKGMIDTYLANPDIDTDEDGIKDAFSIGLSFTGVSCELADTFANL